VWSRPCRLRKLFGILWEINEFSSQRDSFMKVPTVNTENRNASRPQQRAEFLSPKIRQCLSFSVEILASPELL
jgi:hypothetical protein